MLDKALPARYTDSSKPCQQGPLRGVGQVVVNDLESLMNKIRHLGTCIAIGGIAMLSGCVAVPTGPYYGSPAYSQPYYVEPGQAVVGAPSVYINGTYSRGQGYYPRPYYQGRSDPYYGQAPAYGSRRPFPPPGAPRPPGFGGESGPGGAFDPDHGPGRGADRP
jgi:hypothetical protein